MTDNKTYVLYNATTNEYVHGDYLELIYTERDELINGGRWSNEDDYFVINSPPEKEHIKETAEPVDGGPFARKLMEQHGISESDSVSEEEESEESEAEVEDTGVQTGKIHDLHMLAEHYRRGMISFSSESVSEPESKSEKNNELTDTVVKSVIAKYTERSILGQKKYGTTLDRDDLSVTDWIVHVQEELMDATLYLEKLHRVLKDKLAK